MLRNTNKHGREQELQLDEDEEQGLSMQREWELPVPPGLSSSSRQKMLESVISNSTRVAAIAQAMAAENMKATQPISRSQSARQGTKRPIFLSCPNDFRWHSLFCFCFF